MLAKTALTLVFFFLLAPAKSQAVSEGYHTFLLRGKLDGGSHQTIHLYYRTDAGGRRDSTNIINGTFEFKGKVNEPTVAELSFRSNMSGPLHEEVQFFIEAGNMNIEVKGDSLCFMSTTGSATQKEYEQLLFSKKEKLLKLYPLIEKIKLAEQAYKLRDTLFYDTSNISLLNRMEKEETAIRKELYLIDSAYIVTHPASYVSAYLLMKNMDFEQYAIYPADSVYRRMPAAIKKSSYGEKIKWHIDKYAKTAPGNTAPAFTGIDRKGDTIVLVAFKGKGFVLLDFWASWCFPCRQLSNHIKWLHEQYSSKGLEVISVAIEDKEEDWLKAIEQDGTAIWHHIRDVSGTIKMLYKAEYIPAFVLIDKEGKIFKRYGTAKSYGESWFWEMNADLKTLLTQNDQ